MTWDHLHEEDVLYEFEGDDPDDLTPDRFYRGKIDGIADFGVFVSLGDNVTGLLHHSKLERRLESYDWEPGDDLIVQVTEVRDNGDVDLDWSIRQSPREFRGHGVDDPHGDTQDVEAADSKTDSPEPASESSAEPAEEEAALEEPAPEPATDTSVKALSRRTSDELPDVVGDRVRLEGRISDIQQTSGPTLFTLADETGHVECAAFESAGVRAYPSVEVDDIVRVVGVVERHRGEVQVETDALERLDGEEATAVRERLDAAAEARAAPDDASLLVDDSSLENVRDEMSDVATQLRRAVFAGRPITIRHPVTVDGFVGGAAVERALRELGDAEGAAVNDDGRLISRRPMDSLWYDLGDAFYDHEVTGEAENPVVVLVGAGTSDQDEAALEFLEIYDVETIVIDAFDEGVIPDCVTTGINTSAPVSAATIATHIAGMIFESIRAELASLPAVSYREATPSPYRELANEQGVDPEQAQRRYEAVALVAHHQRYADKRELLDDLLFDPAAAELAAHISTQYRERIDTAVDTAQANLDRITGLGTTIGILDAVEHTRQFEFPSHRLLVHELARAERNNDGADVVILLDEDTAHIAGELPGTLGELASQIQETAPEAAVNLVRGQLSYLAGERTAVRRALVEAISERLA